MRKLPHRIYNFSSGPAVMPSSVLEQAQSEMLSINGTGMSVMEMSHRSAGFQEILLKAEAGMRKLLFVPDNFHILFLQGGASLQFSMIPMNFLRVPRAAEYVVTGAWGKKALAEGAKFGKVRTIFSSENLGFASVPGPGELETGDDAAFLHYTSNETIHGVQFPYELDAREIPLICDMSSDIMSRPVNVNNFALIYAGAQKNLGPSGVTVVIIRDDMLDRVPDGLPSTLDYRLQAKNDSMVNTPNTWGIYIIGLVCDWLADQGGLTTIASKNKEKAAIVYNAIDSSGGYYRGHARTAARSLMNVTFRLANEALEQKFCDEAVEVGLLGLRGHRSVGGLRASIYNAFPKEGAIALADFMQDFGRRNR